MYMDATLTSFDISSILFIFAGLIIIVIRGYMILFSV